MEVITMVYYAVIIGNPQSCHTVERFDSKDEALARSAKWRSVRLYGVEGRKSRQAYQATAYEVRVNLEVMEITYTPLD